MKTKDFQIVMLYDDCLLKIVDHTHYNPEEHNAIIDYAIYIPEHKVVQESVRIMSPIVDNIYKFSPIKDGRYIFNRVVLNIFSVDEYIIPANNGVSMIHEQTYLLKIPANTYFVWDNEIYFTLGHEVRFEGTAKQIKNFKNDHLGNIINIEPCIYKFENQEDLVSWLELTDNLLVRGRFEKEFYSICSLNTCVANTQKKWLLNHINTCGNKCNKSDADSAQKDFLFITSYVLDYLISIEDYDQADEILSKIKTSCNSICPDANGNTPNSCGCNG